VSESLTQHYDTTFQEIPMHFILNKCLYETGHSGAAKRGYDRLLKHPQIQELGGIYWMILYDRARIAEQEGDLDAAIEFLERALDVIEEQRSSINTDAGRIGYVEDKQVVYQEIVSLLVGQGHDAEALVCVERSKSRALVDLLASQRQIRSKSSNPKQIQSIMDRMNKALPVPVGRPLSAQTRRKQRGLVVRLKENLHREDPELASLVTVRSPSIKELQERLAQDETLLEYYYDDRFLYAFVMSRRALHCRKLPRRGLEENVYGFRTSVMDPDAESIGPRSRRLFEQLIGPVSDFLSGKALIVVPHGVLHYVPFSALASQEGYLIEHYGIRTMPSASVLGLLASRGKEDQGKLLILANPDLGDERYDLRFAQEEALSIDKIVSHSTLLLREGATETFVKEKGRVFDRLHFASHGVFQPNDPLRSRLLLTGDGANDGYLTVAEIYALSLDADLMVLSACETALGEISNGDDVVGFTRGLLYAGVRSIVSSLWKVDDRATRDLMVHFYGHLSKVDKREALRQAQLAVKERYKHPYYWAAFQVVGNAR
jgi:CHAT domain-containing protein